MRAIPSTNFQYESKSQPDGEAGLLAIREWRGDAFAPQKGQGGLNGWDLESFLRSTAENNRTIIDKAGGCSVILVSRRTCVCYWQAQ